MSRNILFLDFDGVLNSEQSAEMYRRIENGRTARLQVDERHFCPICISNLNLIFEDSAEMPQIILSTAWVDFYDQVILSRMLLEAGFNFSENVTGVTPRKFSSNRSEEIGMWLRNSDSWENYVILDDLPLSSQFERHHVQTDPRIGLTIIDAAEVISILRRNS